MNRLANCLWQDENGVILSAELVVIGSVLVIGLITGVTTLQEAVNGEMKDLAGAIGSLDQSYRFSGFTGWSRCTGLTKAYTAGSWFCNKKDQCREHQCKEPCGDIVAGLFSPPVVGCQGVAGETGFCPSFGNSSYQGGCGSSAACGSWGAPSFNGQPGPRCIDTGVPGLKITEWPTYSNVVPYAPSAVPASCDSCPPVTEYKKSFINIPANVW